jgi:hypothetical protein
MKILSRLVLTAAVVAGSLTLAGSPVSAQSAVDGGLAQPAPVGPKLTLAERKDRAIRMEQQRIAIIQENIACIQNAQRGPDLTNCGLRRKQQADALKEDFRIK